MYIKTLFSQHYPYKNNNEYNKNKVDVFTKINKSKNKEDNNIMFESFLIPFSRLSSGSS